MQKEDSIFHLIAFGSEKVGISSIQGEEGSENLRKTTDGGLSWQELTTLPLAVDKRYINGMEMQDEMNAIIFGRDGDESELFITSDGGTTWTEWNFEVIINKIDIQEDNIVAAGTGFSITGEDDFIYFSNDRGITWEKKSYFWNFPDDLQMINDQVVYSINRNKTYIYTEDGGDTWTTASLEQYSNHPTFAIHFFDKLNGVVGTLEGILKTEDGGETWRKVLELPSILIYNFDFKDELNGWATGTHIWRTIDGGESWYPEYCGYNSTGYNDMTQGIEITPNGSIYLHIYQRGIYKYNPEQFFECNETSTEDFAKPEVFNVFPNPSHSSITINSLVKKGTIQIFNNTGTVIAKKEFNSPSFELNVEDFPSGIYFLRLKTEEGRHETIKLLKI